MHEIISNSRFNDFCKYKLQISGASEFSRKQREHILVGGLRNVSDASCILVSFPDEIQRVIEKIWSDQRILSHGFDHLKSLHQTEINSARFQKMKKEKDNGKEIVRWARNLSAMILKLLKHLRAFEILLEKRASDSGTQLSLVKIRICRSIQRQASVLLDQLREKSEKEQTTHLDALLKQKDSNIGSKSNYSVSRHKEDGYYSMINRVERKKSDAKSDHLLETYLDRGLSVAEVNMLFEHEEVTQARENEMIAISQSISELNEVFSDVHGIVILQGTILDRIDFNMVHTSRCIRSGVENLTNALKYQSQTKYKLIFLLLFFLIFAFFVSFVTRFTSKR